jgi:hypothetical protein
MSRTGRKKVAWLCLSALLFLQLAVSAYACPTPTDRANSMAASMPANLVDSPCREMDQERPKLCEQHCVQDSQSVDTQYHSAVVAPLLSLLAVVVQSAVHFATGPSVHGAPSPSVVDPPPLVRFGVLRI